MMLANNWSLSGQVDESGGLRLSSGASFAIWITVFDSIGSISSSTLNRRNVSCGLPRYPR